MSDKAIGFLIIAASVGVSAVVISKAKSYFLPPPPPERQKKPEQRINIPTCEERRIDTPAPTYETKKTGKKNRYRRTSSFIIEQRGHETGYLKQEISDFLKTITKNPEEVILVESLLRDQSIQDSMNESTFGAKVKRNLNVSSSPTELEEAVIWVFMNFRPGLLVHKNKFTVPEDKMWKKVLEPSRSLLETVIPAVGAIVWNGKVLGTCWLVSEYTVITNRHVIKTVIEKGLQIHVDWNLEHDRDQSLALLSAVTDVLYYGDELGPDVALIKLEKPHRQASPIKLNGTSHPSIQYLATIGFPAEMGKEDPELVRNVFGSTLGVKFVSPGMMIYLSDDDLIHDCSTLHGSSGSVVVDLQTGEAVGLHYHGGNRAVPSHKLVEILKHYI